MRHVPHLVNLTHCWMDSDARLTGDHHPDSMASYLYSVHSALMHIELYLDSALASQVPSVFPTGSWAHIQAGRLLLPRACCSKLHVDTIVALGTSELW
jgi:hypothetical protein